VKKCAFPRLKKGFKVLLLRYENFKIEKIVKVVRKSYRLIFQGGKERINNI